MEALSMELQQPKAAVPTGRRCRTSHILVLALLAAAGILVFILTLCLRNDKDKGSTLVADDSHPQKQNASSQSGKCEERKMIDPNALVVSFLMPVLPDDSKIRQSIRETWVAEAMQVESRNSSCDSLNGQPVPDVRPVCIDVRFFIGVGRGVSGHSSFRGVNYDPIADEVEHFQDIVVLPTLELGSNTLVPKMMAVWNWAITNRAYADFVIKIDTDAYVYAPRFVQHLPAPSDDLIVVGRAHPVEHFKDSSTTTPCTGGELYGFSRALLSLLATPAFGSNESASLNSFLVPRGSNWNNGERAWNEKYEDMFACAITDRTMARHPERQLEVRLRQSPDYTGIWVHSGKLKEEEEYRRCQKVGETCHGENGVSFSHPGHFDDGRCGP